MIGTACRWVWVREQGFSQHSAWVLRHLVRTLDRGTAHGGLPDPPAMGTRPAEGGASAPVNGLLSSGTGLGGCIVYGTLEDEAELLLATLRDGSVCVGDPLLPQRSVASAAEGRWAREGTGMQDTPNATDRRRGRPAADSDSESCLSKSWGQNDLDHVPQAVACSSRGLYPPVRTGLCMSMDDRNISSTCLGLETVHCAV